MPPERYDVVIDGAENVSNSVNEALIAEIRELTKNAPEAVRNKFEEEVFAKYEELSVFKDSKHEGVPSKSNTAGKDEVRGA